MSATDPWQWPDSLRRRLALGHQDEPDVPAYCTCGELTTKCLVEPRPWVSQFSPDARPLRPARPDPWAGRR